MIGFVRRLKRFLHKRGLFLPGDPESKLGGERLERRALRPGEPVPAELLPRVAVVILNVDGRHHLEGCFGSLRELDYPEERLQVILVDNGSTDGSVEEMRAKHAWVELLANERNVGFSAGCNQGARHATDPEVLVFLNNDMRVEPTWLRELVAPIVRGECQAATAKMLSWDGKKINSAGGGMNFHGIGIQMGYMQKPGPEHDVPSRSLFPCGGAMAIAAGVFHDVGGFDQEFFAYYEDVDLGWRLWVMGHEVHYVPSAVCYHHHSSTSSRFPVETVRLLQVRNPLLACFKNYDDENLARVFPVQLALAVRRMLLVTGLEDDTPWRIERATPGEPVPTGPTGPTGKGSKRSRRTQSGDVPIRPVAVADLIGINDLLGNWEHWQERRAWVQAHRSRSDEEIFQLFHKPLWCVEEEERYRALHFGAARFFGVEEMFRGLTGDGANPHK